MSDDITLAPHPTRPTTHLATGKFAPGNHLGGRKKRADENAILAAIDAACPPQELQALLTEAIEWAREYKSPKMALAIANFVTSYTVGQPIRRSVTASTKLETLLDRLGTMSEEEFQVIESSYREGK